MGKVGRQQRAVRSKLGRRNSRSPSPAVPANRRSTVGGTQYDYLIKILLIGDS